MLHVRESTEGVHEALLDLFDSVEDGVVRELQLCVLREDLGVFRDVQGVECHEVLRKIVSFSITTNLDAAHEI